MGLGEFGKRSNSMSVHVLNISQDHWINCSSGPVDTARHSGHSGPWTALKEEEGNPEYIISEEDILIARRTSSNSDGTTGRDKHGVCGIWQPNETAPVEDNTNHPFNKSYSWYLYCDAIETGTTVRYDENWDRLELPYQTLTGKSIYTLSSEEQRAYLDELITRSTFSQETKNWLDEKR
jgi:hypothetical protein